MFIFLEDASLIPDISLSLCLSLPENSPITPEKFQSHEISYSTFVENLRKNPNFLSEKQLLIRVEDKYLPFDVAAPILLRKGYITKLIYLSSVKLKTLR